MARLTEQLERICEGGLSPTFFECTTAMAFQHFADQQVDVALLEVGLGGRFDATNVVQPLACAITTIALDHQEYLGSTLASIAFEKAGIIKPKVPVVLGLIEGEARRTIEQVAQERGAPMVRLNQEFTVKGTTERFSYRGLVKRYDNLSCPLAGAHQLHNAACALALIEAAAGSVPVGEQAIRRGLQHVQWEGRLEIVERRPTVILDGAHNPAGAAALAEYLRSIRALQPDRHVILILGMMRDKDHLGFIEPLKDVVDHVILTQADLPRSATAYDLQRELGDRLYASSVAVVPSEALALAKRMAVSDDLVCVTGSLMLIGEVKALIRGCGLSPLRG